MTTFIVHDTYGFVDNVDGKSAIVITPYVLQWRHNITNLGLFMPEDLIEHKDSIWQ